MLEAIARIARYVDGMDADKFAADERTVDAVVRNLEVLGEAANRLSEEERASCPGLPWDEMRGLRAASPSRILHWTLFRLLLSDHSNAVANRVAA